MYQSVSAPGINEDLGISTVKCRYNAVFGVQEIDRVIAVTAL